jgi:histidine triad (HIT) family protein
VPGGKHRTSLCHMPDPGTERGCLFCRIVAGEIPTAIVASNESAIAFRDIAPQAPLHVLVVPRRHYSDVGTLAAQAPGVLADVVALAASVAAAEADCQFRLIFNTGARSGQSVLHVHGHVIGGAELGWSPA